MQKRAAEFVRIETPKFFLACVVLLALLTLASLFATAHPLLDWFANFRGAFVICALLAIPALMRDRRGLLLIAAVVTVNGMGLTRWVQTAGPPSSCEPRLQVLSINALHNGSDHDELVEQILVADPDIVFICELAPGLKRKVSKLFDHEVWSDEHRNIALFSRYPVQTHETFWSPWDRPQINATVLTPAGSLRVVGAHTTAPFGTEQSFDRNATLLQIAEIAVGSTEPVLVLGDLNITMFSPHYEPLEVAGLRNARLGRGVQATWPSFSPIRIPIDHVMHSAELEVCEVEVGESFGSDHLPLRAGLSWAPPGPDRTELQQR